MLEKFSPDASARYRAQIEEDYGKRYAMFKQMAEAEVPGVAARGDAALDVCEATETAEHSRPGAGDACDDGR
jgi:pyruvate-ferredoxin/flavodoxin oxidoreductase